MAARPEFIMDRPGGETLWTRWELPTWAVAVAVYAAWVLLVVTQQRLPWPILAVLAAYVLAWHFSLQHEAIHGWKSLRPKYRTAMVWLPIGGWLPYEIYKRSHTIHHNDRYLTYPGEDTETQYHRAADWAAYSPAWRGVLLFNQTLIGRLAVGPLLRWRKQIINEWTLLRHGNTANLPIWGRFALGLAVVLIFVRFAGGMPIWKYYLLFVYPGMSLGMLRAFIEHRWGSDPAERIASVESNWLFGLLFLWNNLHIVHHLYPAMPWYETPGFYRRNRRALLEHNGHYVFGGYGEIARRWLVRPVFVPIHPTR
jgi:fatty acid desaturase